MRITQLHREPDSDEVLVYTSTTRINRKYVGRVYLTNKYIDLGRRPNNYRCSWNLSCDLPDHRELFVYDDEEEED